MENVYIQTMLVLYRKCFLPKLLYGFNGFYIKDSEIEKLEVINRKIIRNFAGLPKCAPKISLNIEFGIMPLESEIYKRKLMMWNRLNNDKANILLKNVKREQVNENLPWMQQIIQIACKIGVDLEEGRKLCKIKWKKRVDEKIYQYVKKYSEEEVRKLKKYKEIMKDEIEPGVQKYIYVFNS